MWSIVGAILSTALRGLPPPFHFGGASETDSNNYEAKSHSKKGSGHKCGRDPIRCAARVLRTRLGDRSEEKSHFNT
jgi:hypothetical protein